MKKAKCSSNTEEVLIILEKNINLLVKKQQRGDVAVIAFNLLHHHYAYQDFGSIHSGQWSKKPIFFYIDSIWRQESNDE